jgi:DtxR family Mn-dependent transcriptional regulator
MSFRSAGAEEYLEAIYQFGELGEEATTSRLAEWLGVAPPSVSEMVRRLGEQGLVHHEPYKSIRLSQGGCVRASRLLRRQRLWEVFLYEHLAMPWHQIFGEACRLEHGTSAQTESHLEQFLGHPPFCPHGYPIPEVSRHIPSLGGTPLANLRAGETGLVRRIPERHGAILEYLEGQGIMPGVRLSVIGGAPTEGSLTVETDTRSLALSIKIAQTIVMDPNCE